MSLSDKISPRDQMSLDEEIHKFHDWLSLKDSHQMWKKSSSD